MFRKFKLLLLGVISIVLLLSGSVVAKSPYEQELDRIYGPENGTSITYDASYSRQENIFNMYSTSNKTLLWEARFQVTTHYQIPKEIKGLNRVHVRTETETNTGSNSTYDVTIERLNTSVGGWLEVKTETHNPVNGGAGFDFLNLNSDTTYKIRIKGNVKGTIQVYSY